MDLRTEKFLDAIHKILSIASIRSADVNMILNNITEPNYVELEKNIKKDLDYSKVLDSELEFSASQFSTYERCPRIYQYHYIYKIPSKPKTYFDFGGTVHKVIEEISRRLRNGEMINLPTAFEILERFWNPKGFESILEEKQSLKEISQILERFLGDLRCGGAEIFELEKNFTMQIDDYLVNGVIDRVDSNGEDFVIIDYKTSKESSSAKQALEDIQLVLYCMAAKKLYGKTPKLVGWWFLRQNKKIMVQLTQENTEKVKNKIGQIVSSIRKGDFHPEPGWICKNCDYKLICNDAKY
jgi:ATP-dependent helicase/DNAse subunit B